MNDKSLRRADLRWDGNTLTFTNYEDPTASTASYLTGLDGWEGGVGVVGDSPQRAIHNGEIPIKPRRTARTITLKAQMYFARERDRDIAIRFVSGILQDSFGTLTYNVDGKSTTAEVVLDGEVKVETTGYDYIVLEVPLKAPWPYLIGPQKSTTINTDGANRGLRWDGGLFNKGYLDWGEGQPDPILTNNGNAPAWPLFDISGEMDYGFSIDILGKSIVYPHHVDAGRTVTINTKRGRVVIGGRDVTHMLSEWEWTPIPPYSSISPKFTPRSKYANGFCRIRWNDTYI